MQVHWSLIRSLIHSTISNLDFASSDVLAFTFPNLATSSPSKFSIPLILAHTSSFSTQLTPRGGSHSRVIQHPQTLLKTFPAQLSSITGNRHPVDISKMAICDQVPGLNIAIVVNEGPLAEYALPSDVTKPNERTDYIEPKGGSKFSIKLAFTASLFRQRRSNLCCEIYLDGQFVTCVWIYKEELIEDHERNVGSATYNEEGGRVERDFTFTDVVTGERHPSLALFSMYILTRYSR